jgi:hypothetical protein
VTDKLPLLVVYAVAGLLLALWPLGLPRKAGVMQGDTMQANASPAVTPLVLLGAGAGLLLGSVLPWWRYEHGFGLNVSIAELMGFCALAALFLAGFLQSRSRSGRSAWNAAQSALFAGVATALCFSTLTDLDPDVLGMAWHHWGVYVGESELLRAGARIFHDFPPQYGLGPTLLIASACGQSCWPGAYFSASFVALAFTLVAGALALRVAAPLTPVRRGLVLLLAIATTTLWNAYPALLGSPTTTPSSGGMRFLPALALAALLIRTDADGRRFPYRLGHIAWAFAAAWSFESAFYATSIWWPFYLLLRQADEPQRRGRALVKGGLTLLAALFALIAVFLAVYGIAYRTVPSFMGLFAYLLNPPGELQVNYGGSLWFFVAVIALVTWVNVQDFAHTGNTAALRRGVVVSLLAYSAFSYFLGRSHDNNVLNVLPFMMLALLHAWSRTNGLRRGLAAGMLAGLVGWLCVFNWVAWQTGLQAASAAWFDPHWIRAVLPGPSGKLDGFPPETRRVIARAQGEIPDPVTVMGPANLASASADAVWCAMHSSATLYMFTPQVRRQFLRATATSLRRSGWALVQKSQPLAMNMVPDFDSVYTRTAQFEMDGYLAIHYAPRLVTGTTSP